eukprot:TRINITY_DN21032_c0_g1_i1.p1 TRINITY_DN21032_c0_g1~~TRINITY_DN21032_c0_g1_i1.p1  ORF type:complete len:963 (+),score=238.05 TRINITY_DN21032_c0_g1_i1:73-2961(+)
MDAADRCGTRFTPGGGVLLLHSDVLKERDVSAAVRRMQRGQVRTLSLDRARLSTPLWKALAEGVARAATWLKDVDIRRCALPAAAVKTLRRWERLQAGRTFTHKFTTVVPDALLVPSRAADAFRRECAALEAASVVFSAPSQTRAHYAALDVLDCVGSPSPHRARRLRALEADAPAATRPRPRSTSARRRTGRQKQKQKPRSSIVPEHARTVLTGEGGAAQWWFDAASQPSTRGVDREFLQWLWDAWGDFAAAVARARADGISDVLTPLGAKATPTPTDLGPAGVALLNASVAVGLTTSERLLLSNRWLEAAGRAFNLKMDMARMRTAAVLHAVADRAARLLRLVDHAPLLGVLEAKLRRIPIDHPLLRDPAVLAQHAARRHVLPLVFHIILDAAEINPGTASPAVLTCEWVHLMCAFKLEALIPKESESALDKIAVAQADVVDVFTRSYAALVAEVCREARAAAEPAPSPSPSPSPLRSPDASPIPRKPSRRSHAPAVVEAVTTLAGMGECSTTLLEASETTDAEVSCEDAVIGQQPQLRVHVEEASSELSWEEEGEEREAASAAGGRAAGEIAEGSEEECGDGEEEYGDARVWNVHVDLAEVESRCSGEAGCAWVEDEEHEEVQEGQGVVERDGLVDGFGERPASTSGMVCDVPSLAALLDGRKHPAGGANDTIVSAFFLPSSTAVLPHPAAHDRYAANLAESPVPGVSDDPPKVPTAPDEQTATTGTACTQRVFEDGGMLARTAGGCVEYTVVEAATDVDGDDGLERLYGDADITVAVNAGASDESSEPPVVFDVVLDASDDDEDSAPVAEVALGGEVEWNTLNRPYEHDVDYQPYGMPYSEWCRQQPPFRSPSPAVHRLPKDGQVPRAASRTASPPPRDEPPEPPAAPLPPLRFAVGARVRCTIALGVRGSGTVVATWEDGNAYRVRLDTGREVFAQADTRGYIVAEGDGDTRGACHT